MSGANVLEVENLSKVYSGHTAVNDISFHIKAGEIVGFLGPNGAGKSTTMKILSTFLPATTGTVRVATHDVFFEPLAAQRAIGYMPEHNPLPLELRVTEYLRFRANLRKLPDLRRIDEVIEQCGLKDVERRIVGQLSKGYRQRVGLADALLHEPKLVILDEPTTGLDPNQIRTVRDLIKSLAPKMSVLLSTHILPEVSLTCDRVIILRQGRILANESTADLQRRFDGFANIKAEIKGPLDSVRDALQTLPEVTNLKTEAQDNGYTQFTVTAQGGLDVRSKIFELVTENRWTLRELRRDEYSLEEIFSHLTETSSAA